jgi:palmitoyltransferase
VAEIASLTLAVPLSIALSLLFGWHCYLISNNKTTIEHYEGVRSASGGSSLGGGGGGGGASASSSHPPLRATGAHSEKKRITDGVSDHPYSLGLRANLREILGPRMVCWLVPGCSVAGDGLVFASAETRDWGRANAGMDVERIPY